MILFLGAACTDNVSGTISPVDRTCDDDADCPVGQVCVAGTCKKGGNFGLDDPPDILISGDILDFGAPLLFVPVEKELEFTNVGGLPLHVSRIDLQEEGDDDESEYAASSSGPVRITVQPGQLRALTVTLVGIDDHEDLGSLCIDSDDPDESPACVALVSEIKGDAQLCTCVLDEDDEDPLAECNPTDELIQLNGETGSSRVVSLHNCGTDNRPLTVDAILVTDEAGDGTAPFELENFEDVALSTPARLPTLLLPGQEGIFVRVSVDPLGRAAPPSEDLIIQYHERDDFLEDAIDIEIDVGGCPAGFTDLNADSRDGCECEISLETCNGLDDDCDDTVDEGTNACGGTCELELPPGDVCDGPDSDLCLDDTATCSGTNSTECSVGADNAETCNGLDDNCNGTVDEGDNDCGGACLLSAVVESTCDGADTDLCADDTIECRGENTVACASGDDNVELCNGLDDDCNGTADDGIPPGSACDGPDADLCAEGISNCVDGVDRCSDTTGDAVENCNSTDDDCDGEVDEGVAAGPACDGTDADLCAEGVISCVGGGLVCSDTTGASSESCNGLDDDCDGFVDEDVSTGPACDGADLDLCLEGVIACLGGALQCSDSTGSSTELCNGADDDCDGSIDEGVALGGPCDGADSDFCNEGTISCVGGAPVCSDTSSSTAELCNGLDDDCDGLINEGFGLCTNCCDAGSDADACGEDSVVCTSSTTAACVDVGGTRAETCNGLDDDCDGLADDGFSCVRGTTTSSGCGTCQTRTCGSSCSFGACDGCSSACGITNVCGLSCPGGFHITANRCDFGCGGTSCFAPNAVTCAPNCGFSFIQCGLVCPSGYAATAFSCNFSCSTSCLAGPNSATCTRI